jgi:hypothetical protein
MKASKFLVLAGGILGILAFFLPMVTLHRADYSGSEEVRTAAMNSEAVASAKEGLDAMKGIVMAIFVPAILLAALGALGVSKRRFGRVAGFFSLLFGAIGLGIGMLLKSAAGADAGIGLTFLLATGALGIAGGLFALIKPERAAQPAQVPRLAGVPA